MRRTSTWLVALWIGICSASGQEATSADQAHMPVLNPPAPPFGSIAQRTDISVEWLEKFISTTHKCLDNPSGMPNPLLLEYQVKQVVAYILCLRK